MPRPTPGSRSHPEHDQDADASVQASPLPPPWFVPEPSQPQFRNLNGAVEFQVLSRHDSTESGRDDDNFDNNSVHTGNEHGDGLSWYHEATSQGQREAEALLEAFYDRPTPSSLLGDEGAMDEHVSSQGRSFVETLEPGCNTGQNMSPVARASYGIKSEIPNIEHATGGAIYGASYGTHDVSAYGRTSPMSLRELNESTASSLSQPMKGTENWSTAASNDVSIDVEKLQYSRQRFLRYRLRKPQVSPKLTNMYRTLCRLRLPRRVETTLTKSQSMIVHLANHLT